MDALDHLAPPAADLLVRVDERLASTGAPEGHPVWVPLRRLRMLPGAGVGWVAGLQPVPLDVAAAGLRGLLSEYAEVHRVLDTDLVTTYPVGPAGRPASGPGDGLDWQGPAAEQFAARRSALAVHLFGSTESLAGRLESTAGYADALADWIRDARSTLARTLADVLGSAEAVVLRVGGPSGSATDEAVAAAEIGRRVLDTVAEVQDRGEELLRRHRRGLTEVTVAAPAGTTVRLDITTRLAY